jgi:hypothetical protein
MVSASRIKKTLEREIKLSSPDADDHWIRSYEMLAGSDVINGVLILLVRNIRPDL